MWDIGLRRRRGIGHVYSSAHCTDDEAARALAAYVGDGASDADFRLLKFEAGYREVQWHRNCVAIGLSAGFIEPLEATGIGFAEIAALLVASMFPWNGPVDLAATQFNDVMRGRYANVVEFIKAHYCLSKRRDSDFWIDNCRPETIPDSLKDKLEQWRFRAPDFVDIDYARNTFVEDNWRQVIYGMGFQTDLSGRKGALRHHDAARRAFAAAGTHRARALATLPAHRELIERLSRQGSSASQHQEQQSAQ